MQKLHDPTSPFLVEQEIPPIVVIEENPRVTHSPTHAQMYQVLEERQRSREKTPLKYSYNMDALRSIRQ
jgi:hypothetical protein